MSTIVQRPPIHLLDYGDFGGGKSTFAETFPKPMLIWSFDAHGKDMPYFRNCEVGELTDAGGYFVRDLTSKRTGKLLKRVEYYHDMDWIIPVEIQRKAGKSIQDLKPDAYAAFLQRMAGFQQEYTNWKTVVLDSVTSMEIAARRWDQFVLNPRAEDARQWYGASKDLLERMLLGRLASLPMNVVVLAHIDDEKYEFQGKQKRFPMAPGKLRGSLPSQFQEVYHQYTDDQGGFWLQTRADTLFAATTQIHAANPCVPDYKALWENFDKGL